MLIRYAVSLWNYFHYANVSSLERILALLRDQGYGVELWGRWQEERELYDPIGCRRLKHALKGMQVSLHTTAGNTMELHAKQIDAAAYLGAEVIVIHTANISGKNTSDLDFALARDAVAYARDKGVRLALENGKLSDLVGAMENVQELGVCLDVGHVYFTEDPMGRFLNALKERIIHLHIQDILPEPESHLPLTGNDHYIPETGGIPEKDWELLAATLNDIDFEGVAVFEVRPRNPLQTALLGKTFLQELVEK